jgi:ATP adenylyltransferase
MYTAAVSSLWDKIARVSDRAGQLGALVRLDAEDVVVEDGGIPFVVHVSDLQGYKASAKVEQRRHRDNPFLPPDPELVIDTLPTGHISVLNKFNVLRHHLLIVTGTFEPQEALLTVADLDALVRCMAAGDGLGFYNGGTVAGASQSHKHLQLVPLPLGKGPLPTPVDASIPDRLPVGEIAAVTAFPFQHALVAIDPSAVSRLAAGELHQIYRRACSSVGVVDESRPYNMLMTRRWMLVVPRSREHWNGVSVNGLGFAGSLLVQNDDELERLRRTGPVKLLHSVVDGGASS